MLAWKRYICLVSVLTFAGCGGGGSSSGGGVVASDPDQQDCGLPAQCTVEPGDVGSIEISVPEGGVVISASGEHDCAESSDCVVEVTDRGFYDTFYAEPIEEYLFAGWQDGERALCGASLDPCSLGDSEFNTSPSVLDIIESEDAFLLLPQFLPDREIRRYQPGDVVHFNGVASGLGDLSEGSETSVIASLEILSLDAQKDEFPLLVARLVVSAQERELVNQQVQFWQGTSGVLHELTDESGNVLLDTAASSEGIIAIPVPLEPHAAIEVQFSATWGGHTSTPLTLGNRSIRTGEAADVAGPTGEISAYPVYVDDVYSYLVSFDDYKRDQTVYRERVLWVSQVKGVVGLQLNQRVYSATGVLLGTMNLALEAVQLNF